MDDIVNTIEWVAPSGMMDYRKVGEVRRKYFGDRFPSATGISMHQILGRPEGLIEVTAVALPSRSVATAGFSGFARSKRGIFTWFGGLGFSV